MTPPSSIEEAAKRVLEASRQRDLDPTTMEYLACVLAPQLAQWMEKALPVIEAARRQCGSTEDAMRMLADKELPSTSSALVADCFILLLVDTRILRGRLDPLDTPSSLAAEGTTE